MEKGVGGFGKDDVAFPDKGVANFRGRGERAEAEERVQQLGRMVVRDQQITQPALSRGNVQTLDLGLRPMRDFLLQTDAAMQDQRNIEQILLLHSPRRLCGQEGRTWAAEARGGVQNQRERIPTD